MSSASDLFHDEQQRECGRRGFECLKAKEVRRGIFVLWRGNLRKEVFLVGGFGLIFSKGRYSLVGKWVVG